VQRGGAPGADFTITLNENEHTPDGVPECAILSLHNSVRATGKVQYKSAARRADANLAARREAEAIRWLTSPRTEGNATPLLRCNALLRHTPPAGTSVLLRVRVGAGAPWEAGGRSYVLMSSTDGASSAAKHRPDDDSDHQRGAHLLFTTTPAAPGAHGDTNAMQGGHLGHAGGSRTVSELHYPDRPRDTPAAHP
jgi:hypothetical protein